jgi:thiosulfate reductase cytochrome b subunit
LEHKASAATGVSDVWIRPKHALWIRWAHWVNFPLIMLMLLSGSEIYWANQAYTPFVPEWVFTRLGLDSHLANGMAIHFALMWVLVINGVLYVTYLIASGEWRELVPVRKTFREAIPVILHDLGLRADAPPSGKFNAMQRLTYTSVLVMAALAVTSGLVMYKPVQFPLLRAILGGYEVARAIHFSIAVGFVGFFGLHIVQVIRAGWNCFQAMVTGFEIVPGHSSHFKVQGSPSADKEVSHGPQ